MSMHLKLLNSSALWVLGAWLEEGFQAERGSWRGRGVCREALDEAGEAAANRLLHSLLCVGVVCRQFLALGAPPPPAAVTSCVRGGASGRPGEDGGKDRPGNGNSKRTGIPHQASFTANGKHI